MIEGSFLANILFWGRRSSMLAGGQERRMLVDVVCLMNIWNSDLCKSEVINLNDEEGIYAWIY